MFYQHFIECIYNLNSYDKHPGMFTAMWKVSVVQRNVVASTLSELSNCNICLTVFSVQQVFPNRSGEEPIFTRGQKQRGVRWHTVPIVLYFIFDSVGRANSYNMFNSFCVQKTNENLCFPLGQHDG